MPMNIVPPPGAHLPPRDPVRAIFPPSFAPHRPATATGGGERTVAAVYATWSYDYRDGWKLTDPVLPLAPGADDDELAAALVAAGYGAEPAQVYESHPGSPVALEVYDRAGQGSVEHLVVWSVQGGRHLIRVKALPSLVRLLADMHKMVLAAGSAVNRRNKERNKELKK